MWELFETDSKNNKQKSNCWPKSTHSKAKSHRKGDSNCILGFQLTSNKILKIRKSMNKFVSQLHSTSSRSLKYLLQEYIHYTIYIVYYFHYLFMSEHFKENSIKYITCAYFSIFKAFREIISCVQNSLNCS